MRPLFITRPEPAAQRTAAAAKAFGLNPVVAPLLRIEAREWSLPEGTFDALLLTSVNAVQHAGPKLSRLTGLPAYAVGSATAAAARQAGIPVAAEGATDGNAIIARAAADGCRSLLHLTGEDRVDLHVPENIERIIRVVYRAAPIGLAPDELRQLAGGNIVVALFSPRTARLFAALAAEHVLPRKSLAIAALSPNVASAAGDGWRAVAVARRPDESSLLAVAAPLCEGGA